VVAGKEMAFFEVERGRAGLSDIRKISTTSSADENRAEEKHQTMARYESILWLEGHPGTSTTGAADTSKHGEALLW
jgi:hypothetical protein